MNVVKKGLKDLPNSPMGNESKQQVVEYVSLVMDGVKKEDALKRVYPDRYIRAKDRANENDDGTGKGSVLNANVTKEVRQIERSTYCRKMYESEHKDWWIKFLGKKQRAYETLYDIGLDTGETARNRVDAIRTMLQFMPDKAPENMKIDVTVTNNGDFKDSLREKQIALHKLANEEAIDVSIE